MGINKISLSVRLDSMAHGYASDPAFVRCAVRMLAQMPLREYFGPHQDALEELALKLGTGSTTGSMTYLQAAVRTARIPSIQEREYAAFLLAVPPLRSGPNLIQS